MHVAAQQRCSFGGVAYMYHGTRDGRGVLVAARFAGTSTSGFRATRRIA